MQYFPPSLRQQAEKGGSKSAKLPLSQFGVGAIRSWRLDLSSFACLAGLQYALKRPDIEPVRHRFSGIPGGRPLQLRRCLGCQPAAATVRLLPFPRLSPHLSLPSRRLLFPRELKDSRAKDAARFGTWRVPRDRSPRFTSDSRVPLGSAPVMYSEARGCCVGLGSGEMEAAAGLLRIGEHLAALMVH